jgi:ABC-type antimicrobial peptide transport system permease subunit
MRSSLKALTGGVLALPVLAMAAVPTGAEAVFTSLATDSATVLGYAFTAMAAITGGWIVFRIVKKGAHKVA